MFEIAARTATKTSKPAAVRRGAARIQSKESQNRSRKRGLEQESHAGERFSQLFTLGKSVIVGSVLKDQSFLAAEEGACSGYTVLPVAHPLHAPGRFQGGQLVAASVAAGAFPSV